MPSFDTSDQPLHPAGRPGASLRPRPGVLLSLALLVAGAVAAVGCAEDQQVLRLQDRFPASDAGRDAGLPDGGGAAGINLPGATVALGPNHTCAVASDGRLLCWGDDGAGAVGVGVGGVFDRPVVVDDQREAVEVIAGADLACARIRGGSVRCWGANERGQLGQGDRTPRPTPTRVPLAGDAVQLGAQAAVVLVLTDAGRVLCFGSNAEGQCGLGEPVPFPMDDPEASQPVPVEVPGLVGVRQVSAGQGHVCAVRTEGALLCWGRNTDGQLGLGSGSPEQVRSPTPVDADAGWRAVVAAQSHTCAIDAAGGLFCWGNDGSGQLGNGPGERDTFRPEEVSFEGGDGTDVDAIVQVDADRFHTCALDDQGRIWCWGRNVEGQLGTSDTAPREAPTRIGDDTDWVEVRVGRFTTCARKTDGTLWCTGQNGSGELGLGDRRRRDRLTLVPLP